MTRKLLHPGRPTISMVALEAGVSNATVSRAFSRPELLTSATVDKVRKAADRLGYVPNQVARALSTGRAGNIALIVPDIANPFFSSLMRGAQAQARLRGYATFIGDTDETQELEDVLLSRLAAQVDGFVLVSPRLDEARIRVHAGARPLVIINRDVKGIPRVLIDTTRGFTQAVEHLAGLGHRTVAYIGAPKASWSNHQRSKAVGAAAKRLGVRVVRIPAARPSHEAGQACVERFLKSGATALLAVNDIVAQGLMAGLGQRNRWIPNDFSVVGCDDVIAATIYPPLTTVSTHCSDAGRAAVDLLIDGLAELGGDPTCHVITGEFVVRESTAPPPRLRLVGSEDGHGLESSLDRRHFAIRRNT